LLSLTFWHPTSKVAESETPFSHFNPQGCGGQCRVAGPRGAIDDKGRARQRLESGRDGTVDAEVVRPSGATAQGENPVLDREGSIGEAGSLVRLLPDWEIGTSDINVILPTGRAAKASARAFADFVAAAQVREVEAISP